MPMERDRYPRRCAMYEQLSLLDLPLIPEDFHDRAVELRQQMGLHAHEPAQISQLIREWDEAHQPNPHAYAFYEAQAALYLRLMGRFMENRPEEGRVSRKVRVHEIARLHLLRQQSLEKLRELGA